MEPQMSRLTDSSRVRGLLLVPLIAALCGCGSVDRVRFADGDPGYQISCPGFGDSYAACYQDAEKACRDEGFDLVTRDGATSYGKMLREGYSAQGAEYRLLYGSVHFRSVYVRCRERLTLGF